jgi:transcriptional regulator with XRE-family HTH domain
MATRFGSYFKEKRLKLDLSLREFCLKYGLDPGNLSKLERGILPPPTSSQKLEEYASCLQIVKGSDEWFEFFDLASSEAGKIPPDLMSDQELVNKLPLFFRTVRGQKVPREDLEELIKLIRGV